MRSAGDYIRQESMTAKESPGKQIRYSRPTYAEMDGGGTKYGNDKMGKMCDVV